jgi:putative ABC transport system permease protein
VIGVVGDIRQRRLDETPHAEYYLPISTMPMPWMTVVTRTGDGAGTRALSEAALLRTVRTVVHEANPNLATPGLMPLRQFVDGTITSRRVAMTLVLAFACLTLGLAGVGIYGVMAYTVGERTSEIGVRLALGATSANIVGLIAREGAVIALGGAAVGVVLALGLGRALSALLFNATWADGSIYLIAPVVVVLVALVASYIPARRAARVRPIVALRGD